MFYYGNLLNEVEMFCRYGVETGNVGNSELGQSIPYIFVGKKNGNYMIVQAAIHAREHLTALLAVNLAKFLVKNPHLKLLGGIFFVPMANPDGVRLCTEGTKFIHNTNLKTQLWEINGGKDFSLWKANVDGVDLNVNFDADWGNGSQNVFEKAPQNFVGSHPFSAAETRALANFTRRVNPCVTLSYHLKGEEVYWEFGQKSHRRFRDRRYAKAIANYTGYKLVGQQASAGGYKDWCIKQFKIPSFTVEVGNDSFTHPFPYTQFAQIYHQNEDLPRRLLNTVVRDNKSLEEVGLNDIMI